MGEKEKQSEVVKRVRLKGGIGGLICIRFSGNGLLH